jgi:hypothetical protein
MVVGLVRGQEFGAQRQISVEGASGGTRGEDGEQGGGESARGMPRRGGAACGLHGR